MRTAHTLGGVAALALVGWALTADAHWAERHVLPSYCPTSPGQARIASALPLMLALAGAVVALAAARAARRTTWRLRGSGGSTLAILAAVLASLGVTELHMRRLHRTIALREASAAPGRGGRTTMGHVDARLGWSYFPRRTTWIDHGGRRVAYHIDAEGDRAPSPDHVSDPRRPTLLVTGESIAFGFGVDYDETLAHVVGRDLGLQAVNLAAEAYGSDQAYLRAVDALARYERPVALVTLFVPLQLRRNVEPWRPHLVLRPDGTLALTPASAGPRSARLLQQLPYRGDDALRVTAAVLRATADAARARGAFPLFLVTNYGPPCLAADGGEPWLVDELFVRQRLPFVRVDLGPDDWLVRDADWHPNAGGVRKLAAAVERALASAQVAAAGSGPPP